MLTFGNGMMMMMMNSVRVDKIKMIIHMNEIKIIIESVFSRVHATLQPALSVRRRSVGLSVRRSVGPSVRPSVTLYFFLL